MRPWGSLLPCLLLAWALTSATSDSLGWLTDARISYNLPALPGFPVTAPGAAACAARCGHAAGANAFSYAKADKSCRCMRANGGGRPAAAAARAPAGVVSGFRPAASPHRPPLTAPVPLPGSVVCGKYHMPLRTRDRWVIDAIGQRVYFSGVNWPGHMEALVPEGLQHARLADIVAKIAGAKMNLVRLTYSIDGALRGNSTTLRQAMLAAGEAGGWSGAAQGYVERVEALNPDLVDATLDQVFGAVIDALAEAGVMTLLDNHVSTAKWCCDNGDGNHYWDVTETGRYGFKADEWLAGVARMAALYGSRPCVVGFSPRNELRGFTDDQKKDGSWAKAVDAFNADMREAAAGRPPPLWSAKMADATNAIAAAAPNALLVVGGLNYHTDLRWLLGASELTFRHAGRLVYEAHWYKWSGYGGKDASVLKCGDATGDVWSKVALVLTSGRPSTAPLLLSEWGDDPWNADSGLDCVRDFLRNHQVGSAWWTLNGDYYYRGNTAGYDESFGLLRPDWSDWRDPAKMANLRELHERIDVGCPYCSVPGFDANALCSPSEDLGWGLNELPYLRDAAVTLTSVGGTAARGEQMRVNIDQNSYDNGARLILWAAEEVEPNSQFNLEWKFESGLPEYQIRRSGGSRCIDNGSINNGSTAVGAGLMMWGCGTDDHLDSQRWFLACDACTPGFPGVAPGSRNETGPCKLLNKSSRLCMGWDGTRGELVQQPCDQVDNWGLFRIRKLLMATAASRALPGALALLLLLLLAASGAHAAPGRRGSPSGRLTRACLAKLRGLFGSKACEDETSFKACTDDPAVVYEWHLVCHSGVVKDPAKTFAAPKGSTGLVNWRAVVPGTRAYLDLWNVGPTKGAIAQGILKTITDTYSHTALVLLNLALVDHTRGPEAPGSPPELEAGKIKAAAGHLARLVGFSKAAVDPGVPWVRLTSASPSPGGGGDLSNSVLYVPLTGRSDILASQPIWKSVLVSNTEPYYRTLTSDQQGNERALKPIIDVNNLTLNTYIEADTNDLHLRDSFLMVFDSNSAADASKLQSSASFNGYGVETSVDFKATESTTSTATSIYMHYYNAFQVTPRLESLLTAPNKIPFAPGALKAIQGVLDNTKSWNDFAKEYGNYVLVGYRRRTTFSAVTSVSFTSKQVESSMQLDLATSFKGAIVDVKASVGLLSTYANKNTSIQTNPVLANNYVGFMDNGTEGVACKSLPSPSTEELQSGKTAWVDRLKAQFDACADQYGTPKKGKGFTSWVDVLLGAGGEQVEAILAPITLFPAFTDATNNDLTPSDVPSNILSQLSLNADSHTMDAVLAVWGAGKDLQRQTLPLTRYNNFYQKAQDILGEQLSAAIDKYGRSPNCTAAGCSQLVNALAPMRTDLDTLQSKVSRSKRRAVNGNAIVDLNEQGLCLESVKLVVGDPLTFGPCVSTTLVPNQMFELSPSNALVVSGGDNTCLGYDAEPNVPPQLDALAQVQSCDGSSWQKWWLDDAGRLRSIYAPDRCLEAESDSPAVGTRVVLRKCSTSPQQRFATDAIPKQGKRYPLSPRYDSSLCLTTPTPEVDALSTLAFRPCASAFINPLQQWKMEVDTGALRMGGSGLCLTASGDTLEVAECALDTNDQRVSSQRWFKTVGGNGADQLRPYSSPGKCLFLKSDAGVSLAQLSDCAEDNAHRFAAAHVNEIWPNPAVPTNPSSVLLSNWDIFGFDFSGSFCLDVNGGSTDDNGWVDWFLDQEGFMRPAARPELSLCIQAGGKLTNDDRKILALTTAGIMGGGGSVYQSAKWRM
ncbi:Glycosyl hydrolase 5 family protein [Scenedesmus sp. PABB004]|nr:Glycosyl hydrolase 5 family protein [Scenedesmus sp. PABB004]